MGKLGEPARVGGGVWEGCVDALVWRWREERDRACPCCCVCWVGALPPEAPLRTDLPGGGTRVRSVVPERLGLLRLAGSLLQLLSLSEPATHACHYIHSLLHSTAFKCRHGSYHHTGSASLIGTQTPPQPHHPPWPHQTSFSDSGSRITRLSLGLRPARVWWEGKGNRACVWVGDSSSRRVGRHVGVRGCIIGGEGVCAQGKCACCAWMLCEGPWTRTTLPARTWPSATPASLAPVRCTRCQANCWVHVRVHKPTMPMAAPLRCAPAHLSSPRCWPPGRRWTPPLWLARA